MTIPNSITSIGKGTFSSCSSLTSITIPNSVTSIGDVAFSGCSSLTSITIPNSVTSIGKGAFYSCSSLTSVTIPNSVTSIRERAFSACGLTSVTIPNGVTRIEDSTFDCCWKLTSATIPSSVTSIGHNAFYGCKLCDIYCYAELPPVSQESSFYNYQACVYVPCESLSKYKADIVWGKFKYGHCLNTEETDVENILTNSTSTNTDKINKILKNHQVIILRDGKTYDILGKEL